MAKKKQKMSGGKGSGGRGASSGSGLSIGIFAAVIILVGVLGGVMGWVLTRDGGSETASTGSVKLPDYVNGPTVPKGTAEAYQFAVNNPDVLKYIPCYCGCGQLDGHTSNLDCFIKSGGGDNIVFDDHAAGWDIWVDTALAVSQWQKEGVPLKEIRARIDAEYSKLGYTPTPTPPVP